MPLLLGGMTDFVAVTTRAELIAELYPGKCGCMSDVNSIRVYKISHRSGFTI